MSIPALINKFDGGIAYDPRVRAVDENQTATGFDVFTNPNKLIPYGDSVAETIIDDTMPNRLLQEVVVTSLGLISIGTTSSTDSTLNFFTKTNVNDSWSTGTVGVSSYSMVSNSLFVYKGKAYALGISSAGTTLNLERFDGGGTVTSIGTFAVPVSYIPRPFVHPEDNVVYIMVGTTIVTYDGTTLSSPITSILPTGRYVVSMTNYGIYLAIATNVGDGTGSGVVSGNAITYLWGRDVTLNTFQASLDCGEGVINFIENLFNILFIVMSNQQYIPVQTTLTNKLRIKSYAGGAILTAVDLAIPTGVNVANIHLKNRDSMYFFASNSTAAYRFTKNRENQYVLMQDKYFANASTISSVVGVSIVGDIMWYSGTVGSTYVMMRYKMNALGESPTYSTVCTYTTTINQGMGLTRYTIQDVHKVKQLVAVLIEYTGATSGTTSVLFSVDGSAPNAVISDTNETGEKSTEATRFVDGTEFGQGREFTFTITCTGGSQIKQVVYEYEVIETQL